MIVTGYLVILDQARSENGKHPYIYTVAVHSGYFLRRQFNFAVQRQRGWIAANFLAKANRAGHVREIECAPGRLLSHLCPKQIYAIVGQKNSKNRRAKSAREIRRRLIMLDNVLAHMGKQEFLETDASRRKFFAQFGVKDDALASANNFGKFLPVSVRREKSLILLFTFIDEGQRSIAKFERFLSKYDKLLCLLPAFEVVYVAITPELFKEAHQLFGRLFPARPVTHLKTFGNRWTDFTHNPEGRLNRRACPGLLSISFRVRPGLCCGLASGPARRAEVSIFERDAS